MVQQTDAPALVEVVHTAAGPIVRKFLVLGIERTRRPSLLAPTPAGQGRPNPGKRPRGAWLSGGSILHCSGSRLPHNSPEQFGPHQCFDPEGAFASVRRAALTPSKK